MPTVSSNAPDWNHIASLPDVTRNILQHLPLGSQINLSNVSRLWSNATTPRAFDDAAKAFIEARERGESIEAPVEGKRSGWPLLANARFASVNEFLREGGHATAAEAFEAGGFAHAALLTRLDTAIQRLPHLNSDSPYLKEIAPFQLAERAPTFSSHSEAQLFAYRNDGTNGLLFFNQHGQITTPESLVNQRLAPSMGGMRPFVMSSAGSQKHDLLLMRSDDDGKLSVYQCSTGELAPLPLDAIDKYGLATLSENGRFVGVVSHFAEDSGLIVFDRHEGIIITNIELPDREGSSICVDSAGTAFIAGLASGLEVSAGGGESSTAPIPRHSTYALAPGERQILMMGEQRSDVILHSRRDCREITLKHPHPMTPHTSMNSIAFSPLNAMAALTYSDSSIAVFDLTQADDGGERLPELLLHLPPPAEDGYRSPAMAYFEPAGDELKVFFTEWKGEDAAAVSLNLSLAR